MNDDNFLDRLREHARALRFEGSPGSHERIRAGVRERIRRRESVADVLVAWFRPLAAGLAATAIVAAGIAWMQQPATADLLAGADVATIAEDYYRAAE